MGFQYTLIVLPFLIAAYRIAEVGAGTGVSRATGAAVLIVAFITAWPSAREGWRWGTYHRGKAIDLYHDIRLGYPLEEIARRYHHPFLNDSASRFQRFLEEFQSNEEVPFVGSGYFWVFEIPPPGFRELKLSERGKAWGSIIAPKGGLIVEKSDSGRILEVVSRESALQIRRLGLSGSGDVAVRIEMLSPISTTSRLDMVDVSPDGQERTVTRKAAVKPGSDTLVFLLPSRTMENRRLDFFPADAPGRYRLNEIAVLERPALP